MARSGLRGRARRAARRRSSSATTATCSSSTCAARSATRSPRSKPGATSWSPRAPRPAATPARSPRCRSCRRSSTRSATGCRSSRPAASSTAAAWPRRSRSAPTASGSGTRFIATPEARAVARLQGRAAAHGRGRHRRSAGASPARRCARSRNEYDAVLRGAPRGAAAVPRADHEGDGGRTLHHLGRRRGAPASTPTRSATRRARASARSTSSSRRATSCASIVAEAEAVIESLGGLRAQAPADARPGVTERLVVIGGDAAGMTAAAQARRRRRDRTTSRSLRSSAVAYTSYSACGIPYFVGGPRVGHRRLVARSPEEHRANGIDVRTGHEVVAIDVDKRHGARPRPRRRRQRARRALRPARGRDRRDAVAPGPPGRRRRRRLRGADTRRRHRPCARAVDRAASRRRAVVVGGGYVGLEMAEALHAARARRSTLVEPARQPMAHARSRHGRARRRRDPRPRHRRSHLGHGGRRVRDRRTDGSRARASPADRSLPADLVVLGLGVRPERRARPRGRASRSAPTGGIVTDARMATSVDGVWAAGDCVETHAPHHRPAGLVALGTHANKQGRVAGHQRDRRRRRVPRRGRHRGHEDLRLRGRRAPVSPSAKPTDAGFDVRRAPRSSRRRRAGYYPGAQPITVKVVAERRDGRLLGAQIIGAEGAAKRIDVLATAIWNGMTVDESASSTSATRRRSRRCGTRCSSRPASAAAQLGGQSALAGVALGLLFLEVVLVHHLHELLEADAGLPAELRRAPCVASPMSRSTSAGR